MIETLSLFPILDLKLIELLRSLTPEEWDNKTIARLWTVKDIAAHLLDTTLRTLSMDRDKHVLSPDREINSYQTLVDYLNHLNAQWVSAAKRLSPAVLTGLLEISGKEYSAYLATLDPNSDANFPVAWAGQETSKNWFHVAREYTERWHHQQQIRDAVGKPGIMTKELFYPVMDTFMQGLPHAYRDTAADLGTILKMTIDTAIGGDWYLIKESNAWALDKKPVSNMDATITLQPDTAWKLFTKGINPKIAMETITIKGNEILAETALKLIAVMA